MGFKLVEFKKYLDNKFREKKRLRLVYEGKAATATRAVNAENRYFPVIELKFKIRGIRSADTHGVGEDSELDKIEELVMYLDLEDASGLAGSLVHAISSATPEIPGQSRRIPWE